MANGGVRRLLRQHQLTPSVSAPPTFCLSVRTTASTGDIFEIKPYSSGSLTLSSGPFPAFKFPSDHYPAVQTSTFRKSNRIFPPPPRLNVSIPEKDGNIHITVSHKSLTVSAALDSSTSCVLIESSALSAKAASHHFSPSSFGSTRSRFMRTPSLSPSLAHRRSFMSGSLCHKYAVPLLVGLSKSSMR